MSPGIAGVSCQQCREVPEATRHTSAASCRPDAHTALPAHPGSDQTRTSQASCFGVDLGQIPAFLRLIAIAIRKKIIPQAI